jgi:hypothetical protein
MKGLAILVFGEVDIEILPPEGSPRPVDFAVHLLLASRGYGRRPLRDLR